MQLENLIRVKNSTKIICEVKFDALSNESK